MSSRPPAFFVLLAAVAASVVIAACSDVSSPNASRAEVVAAGPVSLVSTCYDGDPPPPPSDTSSSFSYSGELAMTDAAPRLLPAAMAASGYLLEETATGGTLSVQTTYMLNDANGNGFISFDKVPSIISANAKIFLRNCQPAGGQGTLTIPVGSLQLRINLATLSASQIECARAEAYVGTDCTQLTISGGTLYDPVKKVDVGAAKPVYFQLAVPCTKELEAEGICSTAVPVIIKS
jgi:hypothetical protein